MLITAIFIVGVVASYWAWNKYVLQRGKTDSAPVAPQPPAS